MLEENFTPCNSENDISGAVDKVVKINCKISGLTTKFELALLTSATPDADGNKYTFLQGGQNGVIETHVRDIEFGPGGSLIGQDWGAYFFYSTHGEDYTNRVEKLKQVKIFGAI
jgi:hypothetical protein